MKHNILLTGNNSRMKERFFDRLNGEFCAYTTSLHMVDILNHMNKISPEGIVFCLDQESDEDIRRFSDVKSMLPVKGLQLILIGSKEECEAFLAKSVVKPALIMSEDIDDQRMKEALLNLLVNKEGGVFYGAESLAKEAAKTPENSTMGAIASLLPAGNAANTGNRKHVLVIDDDPIMLKLIKENLIDKYDVTTAMSGKIAYKFFEKRTTDIILLDYAMPGEDGPEVLTGLRSFEITKDIPVVFLTGITEKDKIQKALMLNPQGYLLKPIERDKLLSVIQGIIGE